MQVKIESKIPCAGFPVLIQVDNGKDFQADDGARISGFLLWDASYAEFCFRNDLWPDYSEQMLLDDLKE